MNLHRLPSFVTLFGVALMLLPACAETKPTTAPTAVEVPPQRPLQPSDIVDTKSGNRISAAALIDDLSKVDVVYVGETHTVPEDHRIQLEILMGLYARNASLDLAMEMFPRSTQPVLDKWSRGMLTEEAFLKEAQWEKVWGYPFELYRGIMDFARDKHINILALNAPSSVVRKIARKGLKSLSPGERAQIAREMDLNNPEHREFIEKQYSEHLKGRIRDFQSFYEAQLAWEETMAETLARALESPVAPRQIVVLLGNGHIRYKFGVPQRVWKRADHSYKTVMPLPIEELTSSINPEIADYIWVTAASESPHMHRGLLGVMVRPLAGGKGLEVVNVAPDSAAQKAGIQNGDVIKAIDGIRVTSVEGIHHAFASGQPTHAILLQRGSREVTVSVTISVPQQSNSTSE